MATQGVSITDQDIRDRFALGDRAPTWTQITRTGLRVVKKYGGWDQLEDAIAVREANIAKLQTVIQELNAKIADLELSAIGASKPAAVQDVEGIL